MVDPKAVSKLKDHMEELRKFSVKRIGSYSARQQKGKRYLSGSGVREARLEKSNVGILMVAFGTRSDVREQSAMNLG